MKKGTAEEILSKLPTEAVSGLIFVSVLQSLDSQNWLTQHMRYTSASPGYFKFLETAQRCVFTKSLQMCQIFYSEWIKRGPLNRECCPAHRRLLRRWLAMLSRSEEKGSHNNQLIYLVQNYLHNHSTNVNMVPNCLNMALKQQVVFILIATERFFHLPLLWADLRCPWIIFMSKIQNIYKALRP